MSKVFYGDKLVGRIATDEEYYALTADELREMLFPGFEVVRLLDGRYEVIDLRGEKYEDLVSIPDPPEHVRCALRTLGDQLDYSVEWGDPEEDGEGEAAGAEEKPAAD